MIKRNSSLNQSTKQSNSQLRPIITNYDDVQFSDVSQSTNVSMTLNNRVPQRRESYKKPYSSISGRNQISSGISDRLQFFDNKPSTPSPHSHLKNSSITSDLSIASTIGNLNIHNQHRQSPSINSINSPSIRHQSQLARSNDLLSFERELNSLIISANITESQKNAIAKTLSAVFDLFQTPIHSDDNLSNVSTPNKSSQSGKQQVTLIDAASVPLYNRMQLLITSITSLIMNLSDDNSIDSTNNTTMDQINSQLQKEISHSRGKERTFNPMGHHINKSNISINGLSENYLQDKSIDSDEFDDENNEEGEIYRSQSNESRYSFLTPIRNKNLNIENQFRRKSVDHSVPPLPIMESVGRTRSNTYTQQQQQQQHVKNERPTSLYSLRNSSTPTVSRNSPNVLPRQPYSYNNHNSIQMQNRNNEEMKLRSLNLGGGNKRHSMRF